MKSSAFGSGEFAISQALVMAMLAEERLTRGEQVVDNNNGRSAGEIGRPRADLDWRVGPWRLEEESKEEEVNRGERE
jgi:hypothetical protein